MKVEINTGRVIKPYSKTDITGTFELTEWKKQRSPGQNSYIHAYLFPPIAKGMSEKTGITVTATMAKAILKRKFLDMWDEKLGCSYILPTRKMNTKQCVKFIEDCLKYAAEIVGIYVEEPNEEQWRQIKEPE